MSQLHKRFTSDQVKELLERYVKNEIERKYIQEILGIRKRRFFHAPQTVISKTLSTLRSNTKELHVPASLQISNTIS